MKVSHVLVSKLCVCFFRSSIPILGPFLIWGKRRSMKFLPTWNSLSSGTIKNEQVSQIKQENKFCQVEKNPNKTHSHAFVKRQRWVQRPYSTAQALSRNKSRSKWEHTEKLKRKNWKKSETHTPKQHANEIHFNWFDFIWIRCFAFSYLCSCCLSVEPV